MSEELIQQHLIEHGLILGNYEYYSIGKTTLGQLKKYKIIPNKDYKEYEDRMPDALLVDRRVKTKIHVICVLEYKDDGKFTSEKDKKETVEQCNDLCQEFGAEVGIATDGTSFIWINPKHYNPANDYKDRTTGKVRSYFLIGIEKGELFKERFFIDQKEDEKDSNLFKEKTKKSLENLEKARKNLSSNNSTIKTSIQPLVDPSTLAKQIWQDVWSVSGATPEKCLYSFVELFIFKYLSDLNILDEDENGVKVNFRDLYKLDPDKAFKYYYNNVRTHLKQMFPMDVKDGTTIINGTVLSPDVPEHSDVFYKILKKFHKFGELTNIDPNFKSKVFEEFMKESISKKNWGRYFTPRNIVDAVIEISNIDKLEENSIICDPACGVGGFILEPIKVKENGLEFYYKISGKEIKPRYQFYGYDKGFEKEEQLTIILAKANMLIFLSELIKKNPTLVKSFGELFNKTFNLLSGSILGTLEKIEYNKYDLILTNPPYVTSGSSNYKNSIKKDAELSKFYKTNAIGVEGLFLEWIVNSLKPNKKAVVIIPDGILNRLNDNRLRDFIKKECIIDAIVSLPVNAFYTTPKKTYILAITKKDGNTPQEREKIEQKEPVFTYLVSYIGETLDVKRFEEPDKNDLKEMVILFNQFKGAKKHFTTVSKRCKFQPIDKFNPDVHWSIDRWWTKDEKIDLGIEEEETVLTLEEFKEKIGDITQKMEQYKGQIEKLI